MAEENTSATERQTAPDTDTPVEVAPQTRQRQIERQGGVTVPYTERLPQVRGGICEFCGVVDNKFPSEQQYKLCPHYRGMQLQCSYCDETKDPDEIIGHSVLNVAVHPQNPDKLVVWCSAYDCTRAHEVRFKTNL